MESLPFHPWVPRPVLGDILEDPTPSPTGVTNQAGPETEYSDGTALVSAALAACG